MTQVGETAAGSQPGRQLQAKAEARLEQEAPFCDESGEERGTHSTVSDTRYDTRCCAPGTARSRTRPGRLRTARPASPQGRRRRTKPLGHCSCRRSGTAERGGRDEMKEEERRE